MALISMTGFARTQGSSGGYDWTFEVKSVNGKGLDVRTRLPHGLDGLELELRKLASQYFRRGNLQLNLQMNHTQGDAVLKVNEQALEAVLAIAEPLRQRLGSPPINVESLLGLRGILETAEQEDDEATITARHDALMASANEVFAALAEMRAEEGGRIEKVINEQISKIENLTIAARDCPGRQPDALKARFVEQIEKLLEANDSLDPDRLHAEAVIIATRADVQEELDRLFAHVEAARDLVANGADAKEGVGRKLDFLAQEFNREANTLCSKASCKELSHIGLDMKTTIDQLREQVQNIE
ncbi:MAG TPA: YicC family protein [Rhizobiales bacterium]|nr:YicC family protein [Hyphomicrobiales bacterium]